MTLANPITSLKTQVYKMELVLKLLNYPYQIEFNFDGSFARVEFTIYIMQAGKHIERLNSAVKMICPRSNLEYKTNAVTQDVNCYGITNVQVMVKKEIEARLTIYE